MMNVGNPELAFEFAQLPNAGVGLACVEFIINNVIGIHPKAILDVERLPASKRDEIKRRARGYASPKDFFIEKLVEGVATIAAAFWPNPVIVRLWCCSCVTDNPTAFFSLRGQCGEWLPC